MRHKPIAGTVPDEKPKRFYFDWSEQWSGLNPFQRFNWRDFTLIKVQGELCSHTGRWELEVGLLGFNCCITYIYDHSFNQDMMSLKERITSKLEGRTGATVVDPLGVLDGLPGSEDSNHA